LFSDQLRNLRLAANGIDGHNATVEFQQLQQFRNGGDLIRLLIDFLVPQRQVVSLRAEPQAEAEAQALTISMAALPSVPSCERRKLFNLPLSDVVDCLYPVEKATLKLLRIKAGKQPPKGFALRGSAPKGS